MLKVPHRSARTSGSNPRSFGELRAADEAADRFTAALEIRVELDDLSGQGWMLYRLAQAQQIRGSPDGLTYYLAEADQIASRTGDLELVKVCDTLRRESGVETEEI